MLSPDIQQEEIGENLFEQVQDQIVYEDILPTAGIGKLNITPSCNQYAALEESSDSDGTA